MLGEKGLEPYPGASKFVNKLTLNATLAPLSPEQWVRRQVRFLQTAYPNALVWVESWDVERIHLEPHRMN